MATYSTKEISPYSPYQCPKCKSKINNYEGGLAPYLSCASCCTLYKIENNVLTHCLHYKRKVNILIPIGTKGEYKGKKYQVVGALHVKESNAAYYWTEYVLKAEDGTHDFISEYEGHWSFIKPIDKFEREKKVTFKYKEREFTYFTYYKTVVIGAAGEFNWDLSIVDKPTVKEYISPPYGLIHEFSKEKNQWYETEYLKKAEIIKIFNLPDNISLPSKSGPYSTQPFPLSIDTYQAKRYGILFFLSMLAIVFLTKFINGPHTVLDTTVPIKDVVHNADSNNYVSRPFKITSVVGTTAVDVDLRAMVSNNWIDVSFTMVNEQSGQEYFFDEGVEYYSGYSGGEHWSEGSVEKSITLSDMPEGTYRITTKPLFKEESSIPDYYQIKVTQGATLWSNFFILTIIGALIPLIVAIWEANFITNKWSTSNLIEHE
jgi:hypothetical protein